MRIQKPPPLFHPNLLLISRADPNRLPHHNVHSDIFLLSLQADFLDDCEAHFAVDVRVDIVRTLQIAGSPFTISLFQKRASANGA